MKSASKTLILLDGNALLHRAWHALPPMTTKAGLVVNAAYGFSIALEKILDDYEPDAMAVCWDLPGKTFRHEAYEPYKATREKKPQELFDQIPVIQDILSTFGIPSVSLKGYEADDVIGTLATHGEKLGYHVYIVTGDMDALQLVDEHINVVAFVKGMSETKRYDRAAVHERMSLYPEQLIDYKALRGDPSDNLPGVAGIGEKSAVELIEAFGSVDGIFAALKNGEVPSKYAKKLTGHEKTAEHMRMLVTVVRDAPVVFDWKKDAKPPVRDASKIVPKYRDLEFRSLIRKYSEVAPPPLEHPDGASAPVKEPKGFGKNVTIAKTRTELEAALQKMEHDTMSVMTSVRPADLFGGTKVSVAISDGTHAVVAPEADAGMQEAAFTYLKKASLIIGHDVKALMHVTGWRFERRVFDLMVASYLLHAGSRAHDVASIAAEFLKAKLPEVPTVISTDRDAKAVGMAVTLFPALAKKLGEALKEQNMTKVFEEIEMPLLPVLYDMEKTGIALDTDALGTLSKKLQKRIDALTKQIIEAAGVEFNVNSPSQLADVLFSRLGLPTKGIKKTSTGYSTAASELEKLEDEHKIIPFISEYREISKLQSTYVEALPKLVGKDGRVHTTFAQTVAATGRLSSVDPNLQNIPIRTELGNEVRKAFVAGKGKRLIAADFSQIELRLMAVIAKDEPFIRAFNDGADIHTRTASEIWEVPEDKVTPEMRRNAKAINFGLLYGMGPRALARSTNMSFEEAQTFIEKYFKIHHAVRAYMDAMKAQAHKLGYVETPHGRRRSFPEISSGVPMLVAQAERMAINMPIQGAEADVVKLAMLAVDGWLKKSGWPAHMLLQVHDELVIEADADAADKVAKGLKEIMETVVHLSVPLDVNVEMGKNWGEME